MRSLTRWRPERKSASASRRPSWISWVPQPCAGDVLRTSTTPPAQRAVTRLPRAAKVWVRPLAAVAAGPAAVPDGDGGNDGDGEGGADGGSDRDGDNGGGDGDSGGAGLPSAS